MSTSEEETTSERILRFLSNEEFQCENSKAKEFYLVVLSKLEKAISEGNIDRLKNLSNIIDCVSELNDPATLKDYYDNVNNPIRRTNLVILASKHNRVEILEYLFDSASKVLKCLSVGIGKDAISPKDEDEELHNAFYYAVRSENIQLLDTLIDKWQDHREELDELLSRAYAELKLKNVPLSVELEMNVEKKLIDLRFFCDTSGQVNSPTNALDNIKKRIELLLESIRLLQSDYSGAEKVDGKFLFVMKFIAQNMDILKRQVKSTYDKLPWEEMEFCLVVFVYSQTKTKPQALNLFYRCTLSKYKILNYLEHFAKVLEKEKGNINGDTLHCYPTKEVFQKDNETKEVVKSREDILQDIINNYPHFEQLIDDFQKIRDIHSLQKIDHHIIWALTIDPCKTEGKLFITRCLQVIGEHLKYTVESPKLSRNTGDLLVSLFPKNAKTIITNLRDSISHADSLSRRMEVENNFDGSFFINIQNELKTVGSVITDILYKNKLETIRMLLEKINHSENLDDVKEILEELEQLDIYESITGNFKRSEHEKLEELIKKFSDNLPAKNYYEKELLKKVTKIIDCGGTGSQTIISDYITVYKSLWTLTFILGDNKIDDNLLKQIKCDVNFIISEITPEVEPHNLLEIAKLLVRIFNSARPRIPDEKLGEVKKLLWTICNIAQFGIGDIKSIERLRDKLKKKATSHKQRNDTKCDDIQIGLQLTEQLKDILDRNPLNGPLYIVSYKSDKKLQAAVEMLVLDIMSVSESCLENNQLCLDDYSPLLIGKCLRNHLAHDNALVDILLTDRSRSVILNAKKLTEGDNLSGTKKIGKVVNDDPIKLREKYQRGLVTVTNQEKMFVALRDGKVSLDGLKDYLRNGADIKARSINSWTTLHFASVGSSIEVVKFILDQGIRVDVKDDNGQIPLHVAAAHGRHDIVGYFVTEAGAQVDNLNNREKTPLHVAAQNGHEGTVEVLLNNKANITANDKSGFTPLQYAICNQHVNIVKILLTKDVNADINETIDGCTTLFTAAKYGQIELVNFLLGNGADVNIRNGENNWMPLHVAVFNGHPEVVNALIEAGSSVNSRDKHGCTPLHFAAFTGDVEITDILIDRGADVHAVDKTGTTALHYATKGGDYERIVTTLLENKADPNSANDKGMIPLHFAANYNRLKIVAILCEKANVDVKCKDKSTPLQYAANCGHGEVVAFLIGKGADVNSKNKNNLTALYAAALKGHRDVADILIEHKAEVDVRDNNGYTPLHVAAKNGNTDIVDLLIEKTQINALSNGGYSALHLAVLEGHKDIVELLIKHKAQVNVDGCRIDPFLMAAIYGGSKEIVELLLTNGANHVILENANPLHHAVGLNNKEIVEVLIANGANLSRDGSEALLIAISRGHADIVDILLKHNVNANKEDSQPSSPLHLAAQMGHKRIVIALIGRKADVEAKNDDDVTPLGLAASNGYEEIVTFLIERGRAKVNDKSWQGPTPLHMAAGKGHINVINILLDKKANINSKDRKNRTPIELAAYRGQLQAVKTLLQYQKMNINAKGYDDFTLLHHASLGNNLKLVEYLVVEGSDLHAKNSYGYKAMHVAAEVGDIDIVEFFLNKGMNINDTVVEDNGTMLHMAATNGHLEFAKYLIAEGADINPKDINGMTPICFAACCGHQGIVEILIDKGVNMNAPDGPFNTTILHLAAFKDNLALVHYLITRGADLNVKDSKGQTPIDILLKNDEFKETLLETDYKDVGNLLASIKKLCEAVKGNNSTEEETEAIAKDIYWAAKHGDTRTIRLLLRDGADPNERDVHGEVALHYAMIFKHMDVVDILLEYGADIALVTSKEQGSFHTVTAENFGDILTNLMQHLSQIHLNHYVNTKTTSSGAAASHQVAPRMPLWDSTKLLLEQGAMDVTDEETKRLLDFSKEQKSNDLLKLIEDLCG